jgi:solute carrier family 25 S-adenosylmethionine transporter 26
MLLVVAELLLIAFCQVLHSPPTVALSCCNDIPNGINRYLILSSNAEILKDSSPTAKGDSKLKRICDVTDFAQGRRRVEGLRGGKVPFQTSRSKFFTISAATVMASVIASEATVALESGSGSSTSRTNLEVVDSPPKEGAWNVADSNTFAISATDPWMESISGFVAGGALTLAKTIVKYPLDTATVRLQTNSTYYSITRPVLLFEDSFRGITTPLLTNIPAGAVFFAVKDATKQALKQYYAGTTLMPRWLSTSLAVAVAQIPYWVVRNPSEVVKTRQQANVPGYSDANALDAIQKIWQEGRLGGLYSGFWENIIYAYPADVIKFIIYEALSSSISVGRISTTSTLSPTEGAIYGAVSTAVAQFLTTPLDVVRNRVMAQGYNNTISSLDDESKNSYSYAGNLLTIAKKEGLDGLFAGALPRVGKALLSGAIQFATYEETKASIANYFSTNKAK